MEAWTPIKTLSAVGNVGDVMINAFRTVFVTFSQPYPISPHFASVPFLFHLDPHYGMQNKERGQNRQKLGNYGNVETERRPGGDILLWNPSVGEGANAQSGATGKNYNTSKTNL